VALETVDKRVIMHLARMNATRDVSTVFQPLFAQVQLNLHKLHNKWILQ